jgi:DNA repair protein RecO (recombination protein O)
LLLLADTPSSNVTHRSSAPILTTRAFLLGRVDFGEADLIVHLFTEKLGHITSLARGARRGGKRYSCLEPMHTLSLGITATSRGEFVPLKEACLAQPRLRLTAHLDEMRGAGRALRWIRKVAPPRTPEPDAFQTLSWFLDELDRHAGSQDVDAKLAAFGLRMLTTFGWGLQLSSCVRCGRLCPEGRPAYLNPERGGLVCRTCGGGPIKLTAELRREMLASVSDLEQSPSFSEPQRVLKLVDRSLATHLGFEPDGLK